MAEQIFQVEGPVTVQLTEVTGDLEIAGVGEGQVVIIARNNHMPDAHWQEGVLHLSRAGDLQIQVPGSSSLQVERVHGDISLTSLAAVRINAVGGDAELHNLADLTIAQVSGDLSVKNAGNIQGSNVSGDFEAHRVGNVNLARVSGDAEIHQAGAVNFGGVMGDLSLHEADSVTASQVFGDAELQGVSNDVTLEAVRGDAKIEGASNVTISSVNGDLSLDEIRGSVQVRHVNGDARLQNLSGSTSHTIHTDGDVAIGLAPGPVRLNLRAHGSIRYDRSLGLNVETETRRQLVASIGEGGNEITVTAHGDAAIYTAGEERGRRGRGRWSVAGSSVPVPPIPSIPPIPPIPSIAPRGSGFGFSFGGPGRRQAQPTVSSEERNAILRMLAEGRINAEQAARLLDALGG